MHPRKILPRLRIISRTAAYFLENDLTTSAAALAYFTTLVLFPLLLLLLNLSTTVFGTEQLRAFVVERILELLPGTRDFVLKNIEALTNISSGTVLTCLIIVVWAGSWVFRVIEKAFSRIWHTECRSFLHGRLITIFVATTVGLTLIGSSSISSFVSLIRRSAERLPVTTPAFITMLTGYFWQIFFAVVALLVTIILFAIIYRFLPNTRVSWRESLPGAIVAGILWEIARHGFALLLPYFHYDLVYGSIGAGVALLSWVYISSLIMLFGAQLSGILYAEDPSHGWDEALLVKSSAKKRTKQKIEI
ncbi:MAG: YihY/virulence factor BrkB family protein [Acidobacteriota bacterium]